MIIFYHAAVYIDHKRLFTSTQNNEKCSARHNLHIQLLPNLSPATVRYLPSPCNVVSSGQQYPHHS